MAQTENADRLITVEEFDRMWERGIIGPDDRLELVEGRLVRRETMNAPHASIVARLTSVVTRTLANRALTWAQLPFVATERSKPVPDLTLLRYRDDCYATQLPVPSDVVAIVEVGDTRLHFDRGEKLRLYAKVGIEEYWIVGVKQKAIELYRDRHDLGYRSPSVASTGQTVAFTAFPDVVFAVEELVG
ncbi:MAG TPA: Uma2 family endonuclease [Candidatus Elarobacter sp.]